MKSLLFICMFILSGCVKWELKEHWGIASFSEDDKAFSIVRLSYEQENKSFGAQSRNHTFRVHTALVSNPNRPKGRGKEMKGKVQKIYYMRDRDYVITEVLEENDSGDKIKYYQFLGDGSVRSLGSVLKKRPEIQCKGESWVDELNQAMALIPSPDGSYMAFVRLNVTCEGVKANVKFLNPNDGSTVSQETIPLAPNMVGAWQDGNKKFFNTQNKFAWSESSEFLLGFEELKNNAVTGQIVGWSMSPEKEKESIEGLGYGCFTPETTSGHDSASGQSVDSNLETGQITIVSQGGKVDVFGCP